MARLVLLALLLTLSLGLGAEAATLNANPGNLNSQISALSPGDTLVLAAGTYGGGIELPCGKSTDSDPTTITVADSGTVTINGTTFFSATDPCSAGNHGLIIDGKNRLTFDHNFDFRFGWYGDHLDNAVLKNFELKNTAHHGFAALGDNILVQNVHIHHIGVDANGNSIPGLGPRCGGQCHGLYIVNNRNHITLDRLNVHDVQGWCGTLAAGIFTLKNSQWTRCNRVPSSEGTGGGVQLISSSSGEGNSSGSVAYNNVAWDSGPASHFFIGTGVSMFNNTLHGGENCVYAPDGNNSIRNNICSQNNVSANSSGSTITNNLTGQDPRFVDGPGGDFHLRNDSPAINTGTSASGTPSTDIEGNPRPEPGGSVKDIGAYECQNVLGASCGGGPPAPNPGSIVAAYDFEIGTGTSLPDVTGFGHTGTWNECAGNACWGNGIIGTKAGVFNGSRYVQVTNTTGLKPTESISMVARIALTGTGVNGCDVVSIGDSAKIHAHSDGNVSGQFYDGTTWREPSSTGRNVLDGGSHMLGMSYDGTGVHIRLDAGEVALQAATGLISWTLGANLQIGRHGQGVGGYECMGRIDAVRILDGFCTTECFDSFYGEFVPSLGLAATHSRFEVPDAAEGTTFVGIGTDAPNIEVNRSGKVVQAWSLTRAGSAVPRYFPMFCAVPGFNGGAETKLTNSCATFPVCIANDTVHNMGDSTGNFLPNDGLNNVDGRWVVDTIDSTSRTTLSDGNRTEWRYEYQFGSTLADATVITCKPHDEDNSLLTSYPATIPTITIDVPSLLGGQGSHVGGRSEGGTNQ